MTSVELVASCSFCLKASNEVETMVAGAGVYICNECIFLCNEIIAGKPKLAESAQPWDAAASLPEVLDRLPRIARLGDEVERNLTHWVRKAREMGATWAVIGQSLNMARQSAWERFSGEE